VDTSDRPIWLQSFAIPRLQVKFHPNEGDTLSTASVDGLVNIFDLEQAEEDEALTQTLGCECSVRKVRWFRKQKDWSKISVITHNEDVQLWDRNDSRPYYDFSRQDVCTAMQRHSVDHTYVVDTHQKYDTDDVMVLCGSSASKYGFLSFSTCLLRISVKEIQGVY
jgi:WD40 repeat protein